MPNSGMSVDPVGDSTRARSFNDLDQEWYSKLWMKSSRWRGKKGIRRIHNRWGDALGLIVDHLGLDRARDHARVTGFVGRMMRTGRMEEIERSKTYHLLVAPKKGASIGSLKEGRSSVQTKNKRGGQRSSADKKAAQRLLANPKLPNMLFASLQAEAVDGVLTKKKPLTVLRQDQRFNCLTEGELKSLIAGPLRDRLIFSGNRHRATLVSASEVHGQATGVDNLGISETPEFQTHLRQLTEKYIYDLYRDLEKALKNMVDAFTADMYDLIAQYATAQAAKARRRMS